MIIRKAKKEEFKQLAPLLFSAMDSIVYKFIKSEDEVEGLLFLEHFIKQENNQYSYENIWVAELDNSIVGAINVYDGGNLNELRKPVLDYLKSEYSNDIQPEDETEKGEWYLDTLGVNPNYQGKGIGSALIRFLAENLPTDKINYFGLLVDEDNPNAKKLYLKLGFKKVKDIHLVGKKLEHLQLNLF